MKSFAKTSLLVTILLIAALVVAACAPGAATTPTPTKPPAAAPTKAAEPAKPAAATPTAPAKALEPIKLGYLNSYSGYAADMGRRGREMVSLLEEKINKEGGINGRLLQMIYYDDESDESKGVLAMKKLVDQDKVVAALGTAATGIAIAVSSVAEEGKLPYIASNSLRASVEPGKKWVFKLPVGEASDGQFFYQFLKDKGVKKFALLNNAAGAGREGRKWILATVAQSGLTMVANEEYDPTATDIKPQLTKIKAAGPEGMIVWGAEPAGALAVGQARQLGLNIPIIVSIGIVTPGIRGVKELAEGMEDLYAAGLKAGVWEGLPDNDPQKKVNAQVSQLFKAKYNRPHSDFEGIAYDAFTIMINAIKAANPDPAKVEEARSKIRDALESGTKNYVGSVVLVDGYTPNDHESPSKPEQKVLQQVKKGDLILVK